MAKDNKILVTGACGLIGRSLCNYLSNNGYSFTAVDNFSRSTWQSQNVIESDIIDFCHSNKNTYDIVFHLSAINGTSNFYSNPTKVIENNMSSDLEMFTWCKSNPDCKLIYASTSEIVSGANDVPTNESVDITVENIHNPRWSYRLSKMVSENYLANSDLKYVCVRFFNLFSEHSLPGHFVHDIVQKIQENNFEIIGADETRSFCYVDDVMPALIHLAENCNNIFVNVGSDEEITIKQATDIIAHYLEVDAEWHLRPSLPGSTKRRCPDISKLKSLFTNFSPRSFDAVIKDIAKKL